MTAALKNFVGGEWVDGSGLTRNINPSNTKDVVGEYAKADKAQTEKAIAAALAHLAKIPNAIPNPPIGAAEPTRSQ